MAECSRKLGDWICPNCRFNNFAMRPNCFKCNWSKQNTIDWICSNCHYSNFAKNTNCKKCSTVKSISTIVKESEHISSQESIPTSNHGDWKCSCDEINFGSRIVCRKCGHERPPNENEGLCAVCLQNRADICLKKCGHIAVCQTCANNMNACPICRVPYSQNEDVIKIFKVV